VTAREVLQKLLGIISKLRKLLIKFISCKNFTCNGI